MKKEVWRTIAGGGRFEVSNKGGVRRRDLFGRITRVAVGRNMAGKLSVYVRVGGQSRQVPIDRLVGEAFCAAFRPHLRAQFINGDRDDLRPSNLRWATVSEISKKYYNAKNTSK